MELSFAVMSQAVSTKLIVSFSQKIEALKRESKNSNVSKKLTSLLLNAKYLKEVNTTSKVEYFRK